MRTRGFQAAQRAAKRAGARRPAAALRRPRKPAIDMCACTAWCPAYAQTFRAHVKHFHQHRLVSAQRTCTAAANTAPSCSSRCSALAAARQTGGRPASSSSSTSVACAVLLQPAAKARRSSAAVDFASAPPACCHTYQLPVCCIWFLIHVGVFTLTSRATFSNPSFSMIHTPHASCEQHEAPLAASWRVEWPRRGPLRQGSWQNFQIIQGCAPHAGGEQHAHGAPLAAARPVGRPRRRPLGQGS